MRSFARRQTDSTVVTLPLRVPTGVGAIPSAAVALVRLGA